MFDDEVTLLEPPVITDPYTEDDLIDWNRPNDWTRPPVEHPSEGDVQVTSSTEAVLTAGTVVQKARCWLPPEAPLTTAWRIRWDGDTFEVDGEIERKKVGREIDHLHCWLKRVAG